MIPAYRYMDSHPFQKNQTPFNQYQYNPSMETIPSYVMMDPAKSRMPYNSGPDSWFYGYPTPFYSCCDGGNFFPGHYSFRPPQQHMHCGGYPPCREPYYVPYVPPPHYNVEQPRYEFGKNMMRNHHCCGCPKNLCGPNQMEDKCVKIEDEKPDIQRKGSLVPIQLGNNRCPIVWIPPDYMGREKERDPYEAETTKQEKERHGSNSTENLKSFEKAPKVWSEWPLSDLSRLRSWLPDAERMGAQSVPNKQQEDGKKELPFPIIWMPAFGREETTRKDVENMNAPTKPTAEPSDTEKSIPISESSKVEEKSIGQEDPEVLKTINGSNIPEMDRNLKTEDPKKKKERRCIPVEAAKDNEERESSRNNVKGQSSSSPKKPRLPPVCLRVDPLPKKRNCNGSSPRSHSSTEKLTPAAVKEKFQQDANIGSRSVEPNSKKIIKAVEVKVHESLDGKGDKENISSTGEPLSFSTKPQDKCFDKLCEEGTEGRTSKEYREKDKTVSHASTEKAVDEGLEESSGDLFQEEGKIEKPHLSDIKAAVLIQSAYRGYEVRKWELLKKLKQIAEVRQQAIEVKNRVQALELAPQDEKERMFIGEMIMRFLLKLDTIQGLHPSAREFRKSLAKELVALQEKLDRIITNKPSEVQVVQEASLEKLAENFDVETPDSSKEEAQHQDDILAIGESFPEGPNESNSLLGAPHGAQPLGGIDNMAGYEVVKSPADEELQKLTRDIYSELPEDNDENTKVSEAEQSVELRESGYQNEDTSELSSHNFSNQLAGQKVSSSLMGYKNPEEQSGAEMEQNMEVVTDAEHKVGEILQMDAKEETVDYQVNSFEDGHSAGDSLEVGASSSISDDQVGAQAGLAPGALDKITISANDENGKTENSLPADMELLVTENDNPNNFEADKFEHIEMRREVSLAKDNAHDLAIKSSTGANRTLNEKQCEGQEGCHTLSIGTEHNDEECSSYKEASDESAEVPGECKDASDESAELSGECKEASNESIELSEELSSNSDGDRSIQNEMVTERNEQQAAPEEEKIEEDVQLEPCVNDLKSSRNLDNQANELQATGESTLDRTSIEWGEESLPASQNTNEETMDKHDLESEKEMDKKLIEENEKMREMVEKLMEAGKEQISIISKLSGRVKELESRLARKKKLRRRSCKSVSRHPMLSGRIKA